MKNIHLIKTDKPSRLHLGKSGLVLCDLVFNPTTINSQNIYITDNSEIKEGDWLIVNDEDVMQMKSSYDNDMSGEDIWVGDSLNGYAAYKDNCKKIILTTDDQLIQNGVQAVDGDFLEWFVKNPSCEKVKTYSLSEENGLTGESCHYKYEIIIPQEEPKQNTMDVKNIDKFLDSLSDDELKEKWNKYNKHSEQENSVTISEFIENIKQETLKELYFKNNPDKKQVVEKRVNAFFEDYNKQETVEEAAKKMYPGIDRQVDRMLFIQGAKWQAEKMYSEEEVFSLIDKVFHMYSSSYRQDAKEWFKQFKKK
jgi:hypothetical protein